MATFKFHLAKQTDGKENRLFAECGKSSNTTAVRVVKTAEFVLYEEKYQCLVCLGRAKELGLIK